MLSLNKKLYQLIISRLDGKEISSSSYMEQAVELVRKGIGGFILFGGNKDELKRSIRTLQTLSEIPLFIASDLERGPGQQIEGATIFPAQMAVAAAINREDSDEVKILGNALRAIAEESIDIGINMPLIPVIDINSNPDNPIICTRAFSDNPEVVAWYGNMYIEALEDSGLISCAKHFPGHGDTAADSHISLPVISKSLGELRVTDLYPFIEAVRKGVSSIMAGHLSIPAVDELPASLSGKFIADLLRSDIGFDGLVLTDALNMHALNEFKGVPSKCINAGVDILLHPADAGSVIDELKQAVSSGVIKKSRIDTAVERILKYKSKIESIQQEKLDVDYGKHAELSSLISDKSVTLVKDRETVLPLKDRGNISLVVAGDEYRHDWTTLKKFTSRYMHVKNDGGKVLKGTTICALFSSIAAWEGSSGIRENEADIIRERIKKSHRSIVVSFGSPYVLRHFTEADVLIAAYDTTQRAQASVIKCLKGELAFTGKLPVEF